MKNFFGAVGGFLKKHKKLVIFLIILALIVALVLYIRAKAMEATQMLTEMANAGETAQIEYRSLVDSLSATGTIVSTDSKDIVTNVSGVKVLNVNFEVGDTVHKGDVICVLDSKYLETSLSNVKANLSATNQRTNADLAVAQRMLSEAQESRNIQIERDFEDAATAWKDYQDAVDEMNKAKAEYDTATANYNNKKADYDHAQNNLDDFNGVGGTPVEEASKQDEINFVSVKEEMNRYMAANDIRCFSWASVAIASDSLVYMNAGDDYFDYATAEYQGEDEEEETYEEKVERYTQYESQYSTIDEYLDTLKSISDRYKGMHYTDGTNYMTSNGTSLKSKMSTAEAEMNSKKQVYEAKESAAEGALKAYKNVIRGYETALRNNDSAIMSRNDNLNSSKTNSSVAGLTEKQQIEQYEDQIDACTVSASMDGIITSISVSEGATYAGGPIATIEDISEYKISAQIDEYDIAKIKVGQKVVIKTNGTGDLELQGTVSEIAPRATKTQGLSASGSAPVTYAVEISIDTPCEDLKMDMTAKLSIILSEKDNVLTVPYDAVQTDEDGKFFIELANEAKDKIYVEKGIASDYYIEVIGDGVKEGIEITVPSKGNGLNDFMNMLVEQGAMGGF